MPESLSTVDRALWRIAELGARCGQLAESGDRRPLWQELEQLIADLGGELSAAPDDSESTAVQLRRLEGRLQAARKAARGARTAEQASRATAEQAEAERVGTIAMLEEQRARCADLERARDAALAERDAAVAERDAFTAHFADTVSLLAAKAQGAVVALPR